MKALQKDTLQNVSQRLRSYFLTRTPMQVVEERLAYEMNVIAPKGMCDYLLIVWDFIYWAKKQGHSRGPGTGFWSRIDRSVLDWRYRHRTYALQPLL